MKNKIVRHLMCSLILTFKQLNNDYLLIQVVNIYQILIELFYKSVDMIFIYHFYFCILSFADEVNLYDKWIDHLNNNFKSIELK